MTKVTKFVYLVIIVVSFIILVKRVCKDKSRCAEQVAGKILH